MTTPVSYPGIYTIEVTGPAVITGVSTSNAGFLGPALAGPLKVPRRVTSLDEFIDVFGVKKDRRPWPYLFLEGRPYYLGFAIEGFFANGGQTAYVVRVGTAVQSSLAVQNQATPTKEDVFIVRAIQDGKAGDDIAITVEFSGPQRA